MLYLILINSGNFENKAEQSWLYGLRDAGGSVIFLPGDMILPYFCRVKAIFYFSSIFL